MIAMQSLEVLAILNSLKLNLLEYLRNVGLNVVQLDNGKFHHSIQLKIPSGYFTGFSATWSVPN